MQELQKLNLIIWVCYLLVVLVFSGFSICTYKWGYSVGFEAAKKELLHQHFNATHELHEIKEALILIKK